MFDETYPIFANGYHILHKYDKDFVRIFYHDSSTGHFFTSHEEARFSQTRYKQSVLRYVTNSFLIDDVYEFILVYPELFFTIHWTQTTLLTEDKTSTGSKLLDGNITNCGFQGLSLSSDHSFTYIDGTPGQGENWWYPIGALHYYKSFNTFPGPFNTLYQSGYNASNVSLYIRISNVKQAETFPPFRFRCTHKGLRNNYHHLFVFLLMFES